jgi:FkbM family methyltransferase
MDDVEPDNLPPSSFSKLIGWLWKAGLRYGGVIDVGCGEGLFALSFAEHGPFRFSTLLNIDAQDDYRNSLAAIHDALGGHFRICAVGERDQGTIELQRGAHPYWSSMRPPGDRYWTSHNGQRAECVQVPVRTLDSLVEETALPGPYFLKLDVQGAELEVLAGARRTLTDTSVVLVETAVEDFTAIHEVLTRASFDLFDLTGLERSGDSGALGWFYPVYLNARHRGLRPVAYWDPAANSAMIAWQEQHRDSCRMLIADSLARLRAGGWKPITEDRKSTRPVIGDRMQWLDG